MNKEFEAYHSRLYPWLFMLLFALISGVNVYMSLSERGSGYVTVILGLMAAFLLYFFFTSVTKRGIAIELTDDTLIFHKKSEERFPLSEIATASLHERIGSFDIYIELKNGERHSCSCFVKDDRAKKKELALLLRQKGVDMDNYDFNRN